MANFSTLTLYFPNNLTHAGSNVIHIAQKINIVKVKTSHLNNPITAPSGWLVSKLNFFLLLCRVDMNRAKGLAQGPKGPTVAQTPDPLLSKSSHNSWASTIIPNVTLTPEQNSNYAASWVSFREKKGGFSKMRVACINFGGLTKKMHL